MKRYSTVHPLYLSFYSKDLYRDVARNWGKTAFLYLFLLLAVCAIPVMFKVHAAVSDYLRNEAPDIVKQIPTITISKGVASVSGETPYIIKDPKTNTPFFIIDTTGKTVSLKGSEAVILLTKTKLFFRSSASDTRAVDLSEIDALTISPSTVYDWIETFLDYFIYLFYPFALLFSFLFRAVEALIFGVIGTIFAKHVGVPLAYRATLGIAAVSLTPAIILDTFYNYAEINIPFWWLFDFLVALGYLLFAVQANTAAHENTGA